MKAFECNIFLSVLLKVNSEYTFAVQTRKAETAKWKEDWSLLGQRSIVVQRPYTLNQMFTW